MMVIIADRETTDELFLTLHRRVLAIYQRTYIERRSASESCIIDTRTALYSVSKGT